MSLISVRKNATDYAPDHTARRDRYMLQRAIAASLAEDLVPQVATRLHTWGAACKHELAEGRLYPLTFEILFQSCSSQGSGVPTQL